MSFECSDVELRSSPGLIDLKACWVEEMMNGGARRTSTAEIRKMDSGPLSQGNNKRSFPASYFSIESLLILVCLTASLLILPLILPPLPPPPFMLLLLPIGILVVLMILAFMPSDVRDIASAYV